MKSGENYEIHNLRFGEFCTVIEFCSNCQQHNNSLRHDEQKYLNKALELKTRIQQEFPFMKIYLKPLQTSNKENVQRLGLFEVFFASYNFKEFQIVGSKLTTLKWPQPKTVINNIRQLFDGKCVDIQLNVQELHFFHPENPFLSNIKIVLTTEIDFQSVVENYQNNSQKRKNSSKKNFKKQRKLSSVVKKKISSGFLKEEDINNLLVNKKYCVEKITDDNLKVSFVNIKPGNYKFIVLGNENLNFSVFDLQITPYSRKNDQYQNFEFCLEISQKGILNLNVQFFEDNPLIRVLLKSKEDTQNQSINSGDISNLDIELFLTETLQSEEKFAACFKSKKLDPGIYELSVEYRNYEFFQGEIFIFQGQNLYELEFPQLKLNYDFKQDDQLINAMKKQQNQSPIMPVIIENPKIENKSFYSQNKKSQRSEKQNNNKKSKSEFNFIENQNKSKSDYNFEDKENYTNQQPKSHASNYEFAEELQPQKQSKNLSSSFSSKQNTKNQNLDFDQESFESISKKHSKKSSLNRSSLSKKSKSSESSKSSKSSKKKQNIQQQKQQISQQRIVSGNKKRPGERLYSAKSNNFSHPQPDEHPKKQNLIQQENAENFKDGVWENLKFSSSQFQIFLQENQEIELGMDFIMEIEDVNKQNFMEENQQNNFQQISLNYIEEFRLGRIFIKKIESQITEDFYMYLQCNGNLEKIYLSKFLNQLVNQNEEYCDVCILTKQPEKKFQMNIFLVPMEQPLVSTTGLFEIKNLVNFVSNSKFSVSKFFGFELEFDEESNQKKDFTISEKEALECLKNYEIYCKSNYLLNSIKYDKNGNLSLRKLEKLYPKWQRLINGISDLLSEIEKGEEESLEDDEFDPNDFDEF